MNDTLKKWLLYLLAGLVPVWLLDTVLIPRLGLSAAPVLLPVCVVAEKPAYFKDVLEKLGKMR